MKDDIKDIADIKVVVDAFYEKIKVDQLLSYFFTDTVKVNWERHLPIMYNFWENILFYTGSYEGNPMKLHQGLNARSPISMDQFNHWTDLFNETVDEYFEGEKAEMMKQRAVNISTVMQIKILGGGIS